MSIALAAKQVHCPNCHHEGKAKIQGTGGAAWVVSVLFGIIGLFFWPLIPIAIIVFIYAVFKPAKQICSKCKWEHPVPLDQWKQTNAAAVASL